VTPSTFALTVVADGFPLLTDVQPVPGQPSHLAVSVNGGTISWVSMDDGSRGEILRIPEIDESKEGILGFAFHPGFPGDDRIFVHYSVSESSLDLTRISSFHVSPGIPLGVADDETVVLQLDGALPNHNGGAIAFGPDGMLYAAFGDGGTDAAPTALSQDPLELWGKAVRLDIDRTTGTSAYGIPPGNPFVGRADHREEIFALGLRNPWRMSFAPDGALLIGDVGADGWEELDVARGGENFGWNEMEGAACWPLGAACNDAGMTPPLHAYEHGDAACITAGHVYQGSALPALDGLYVFADYERGTIWAFDLEGSAPPRVLLESERHLVTIARDEAGELYVGDIISGEILRLSAKGAVPAPK